MSSNEVNAGISKRKSTRYAVSDDCRIRASIRIRSSDEASSNKDWPGTLVDLSSSGAHIQISMAAVAYKGDSCVLKLACGAVKIEVRATLAHYVCSARYSVCGVKFDHSSPDGYEQFLKAVVASSTLKVGETSTEAGRYREDYTGPGFTKLLVWRNNKPERAVVAFEYTMGRYAAVLTAPGEDLFKTKEQVLFKALTKEGGVSDKPLSDSQLAEARWEFNLAASNLPKVIPPELRKFLRLIS
jgi:hypothetical protein